MILSNCDSKVVYWFDPNAESSKSADFTDDIQHWALKFVHSLKQVNSSEIFESTGYYRDLVIKALDFEPLIVTGVVIDYYQIMKSTIEVL